MNAGWKRLSPICFVVCIGLMWFSNAALSTPLLFEYSGVVRHIAYFNGANDPLGFAIGQQVSGSFVYDRLVPDQSSDPEYAFFQYALSAMSFGGIAPLPADIYYSYVLIDADPSHDHVAAHLNAISENVSDVFQFSLEEGGATAVLGNDQIDLTTLSLTEFEQSNTLFSFSRAVFHNGGSPLVTQVLADLRVLRAVAIPEPPTLLLLCIAIPAVLAANHSWSRRCHEPRSIS